MKIHGNPLLFLLMYRDSCLETMLLNIKEHLSVYYYLQKSSMSIIKMSEEGQFMCVH